MNINQAEMLLFYSLLKGELKKQNIDDEQGKIYAQNLADTMNKIKKSWQREQKRQKRMLKLEEK